MGSFFVFPPFIPCLCWCWGFIYSSLIFLFPFNMSVSFSVWPSPSSSFLSSLARFCMLPSSSLPYHTHKPLALQLHISTLPLDHPPIPYSLPLCLSRTKAIWKQTNDGTKTGLYTNPRPWRRKRISENRIHFSCLIISFYLVYLFNFNALFPPPQAASLFNLFVSCCL